MRLRTFYVISLLLPLLGGGIVAALGPGDADLAAGLGPGGKAQWLYPESATRGILAYGIVALWLIRELRRRSPATFERLLWLAPLANVAANVLVLAPLVLIHGRAADLLSEQGGRVGLRLVVLSSSALDMSRWWCSYGSGFGSAVPSRPTAGRAIRGPNQRIRVVEVCDQAERLKETVIAP